MRTAMERIEGIYAPSLTPFAEDGRLDFEAFAFNLQKQMDAGLDGIVLFGTSGEYPYLSEEEKEEALTVALTVVPADRLIVQVGSLRMDATLALAKRSAKAGVLALLAITPFYYLGAMKGAVLTEYYRALGAIAPTMIYHIPQNTGLTLDARVFAELSEVSGVVGMKDSSGSLSLLTDVCSATKPSFRYLTGSAQALCSAYAVGAAGGILGLADVVPGACARVWRLLKDGRQEEARSLERSFTTLNTAVTRTYGIAGLKAAAEMLGYRAGVPRRPLLPLAPEAKRQLAEIVAASAVRE